jgi:hypothetical protein
MNVPIRMLGITTVIFWVFLVGFIVLAAYSIKDLGFSFGETQISTTPNAELVVSLPVFIENRGYCNLDNLQIKTVISEADGSEITTASTSVPTITNGESMTTFHNVTLDLQDLLETGEQYLLEDKNLAGSVTAGLTFAELLPVQISSNFTFPWGAPFYNFSLGPTSVDSLNLTYYRLTVSLSFENHAAFDLEGNIRIQLHSNDETLISENLTDFSTPRQSSYDDEVEFQVALNSESLLNHNGHFEVYFSTSLFDYGPLVIPYG